MKEKARLCKTCVTVIIPTYNSERTLSRALESLLTQSFGDWRALIIDDGSNDGTVEIARRYCRKWPNRFSLLEQANRGPAAARNLALKQANGEFVAFLDSDDSWVPDKLEIQIALMRSRPDLAMCHSGAYKVDAKNAVLGLIRPKGRYSGHCFESLLVHNGIVTTTVLAKTAALLVLEGFDETLRTRSDWDMWIRVAEHNLIEAQSDFLAHYRVHDKNISNNINQTFADHLAVIQKYSNNLTGHNAHRICRQARSEVYYDYGVLYYIRRDYRTAATMLMNAARLNPLKIAIYRTFIKLILLWAMTPFKMSSSVN